MAHYMHVIFLSDPTLSVIMPLRESEFKYVSFLGQCGFLTAPLPPPVQSTKAQELTCSTWQRVTYVLDFAATMTGTHLVSGSLRKYG